jgi:hypothetical protein
MIERLFRGSSTDIACTQYLEHFRVYKCMLDMNIQILRTKNDRN